MGTGQAPPNRNLNIIESSWELSFLFDKLDDVFAEDAPMTRHGRSDFIFEYPQLTSRYAPRAPCGQGRGDAE